MKQLSAQAKKTYEHLLAQAAEGENPSVREICAAIGVSSTSTVHRYLGELERAGLIQRRQGSMRNITILGQMGNAVKVPLVGMVAAGQPILAVEDIEDYISLPTPLPDDPANLFALRVKGESMKDAGILPGDILIIRRTAAAENGQVVVALVEDEATVKRFFKEDGRFRLQPENSAMEPIYLNEVVILGHVAQLVREYHQ